MSASFSPPLPAVTELVNPRQGHSRSLGHLLSRKALLESLADEPAQLGISFVECCAPTLPRFSGASDECHMILHSHCEA